MTTQTLTRDQRMVELEAKKKALQEKAALEAEIKALESQLDDEEVDWPRVRVDSRGRPQPVGCKENTTALLNKFGMGLKYNEMSKAIECMRSINRALLIDADEVQGLDYELGSAMFQGSSAS